MEGYIDMKGKFAIKPQYEQAHHFHGGYAEVTNTDGEKAAIDTKGELVLPFQRCSDITPTRKCTFFIKQDGVYRLYDMKNHRIGTFEAGSVFPGSRDTNCELYPFTPNPYTLLGESGGFGVVDSSGIIHLKAQREGDEPYLSIHEFSGGYAVAQVFKEGSHGNSTGVILDTRCRVVYDDLWGGDCFIDGLLPIDKPDFRRAILDDKLKPVYVQNRETDRFVSRSHFGYYFVESHEGETQVYHKGSKDPLFTVLKVDVQPLAPNILALREQDADVVRFVDDRQRRVFDDIECSYITRTLHGSPFIVTEEAKKTKEVLRRLDGSVVGEYKEVTNHYCGLASAIPLD